MTTTKKGARRKLSLLHLATEFSNVSHACRLAGYSRQHFYEAVEEMQKNLDTYLVRYNTQRAHQGLNMREKLPLRHSVRDSPTTPMEAARRPPN